MLGPQQTTNSYNSPLDNRSGELEREQIPAASGGLNVTAVVGFGDQTTASNITYTNITGGLHVFRTNAGAEVNDSHQELTKLNDTHYRVRDFGIKPVGDNWNVSVTACAVMPS